MQTAPRPIFANALARQRPGAGRQQGFTMVEAQVCLSILSLLLAGAITATRGWLARHAIEATAALLETDLKYARSLALVSDNSVRFQVQAQTNGGTCYIVFSGAAGSCSCSLGGVARCQADGVALRVAEQAPRAGVRVLHSGKPLVFDAGKGTVTPTATLVVADADGRAIHQVVNIMGRTRSCSPDRLAGLRTCT